MWRSVLLLSLPLAACSIHTRPQLRWIGEVTPTQPSNLCAPGRGVLVMREGKVSFAPDEGTWVLTGTATPGSLEASRSRVTPEHKSYDTKLEARWTEAEVNGTYTTPRCTYRVALSRK